MSRTLAIVMDPIDHIKPYKDTSLALALAAQAAGWQLRYLEQGDLFLRDGVVMASLRPLQVWDDSRHWFELGSPEVQALSTADAVFMRKDPPFDMEYVYSTYLLEIAQTQGCVVVNDPRSIRDCNEKLFATLFPQCMAPTLVTRDSQRLRAFTAELGKVVMKPLDGMGGTGVFVVAHGDGNTSSIIETLTNNGRQMIMAQRYLPEIAQGDKRILMLDGIPFDHCLARVPAPGEARGNLAAGGQGIVQELSARDHWLAAEVGPELKRRGLFFVGLDVIGDYVTEINVTSPTCLHEISKASGQDLAAQVIAALEKRVNAGA